MYRMKAGIELMLRFRRAAKMRMRPSLTCAAAAGEPPVVLNNKWSKMKKKPRDAKKKKPRDVKKKRKRMLDGRKKRKLNSYDKNT